MEKGPELFNYCDYLIPFEGESSLQRLLEALSSNGPLARVPNLVYRFRGEIRKNPIAVENINALPTPDYGGMPLDSYLAAEPVFLLYTSRGCYWSKCNFCNVSASMRTGHRSRSVELVYEDICRIKERHGAKYIFFADDCVPPRTLAALVSLLRDGPEVYWQCEARFERSLSSKLLKQLRQAGCLNLIFGLESYSPKVLRLMNKGIEHSQVQRIVDDCRRNDIAFNLQFFFGFPGESLSDAEATHQFVRDQAHGSATFSFGTFKLERGCAVEKNPAKFGIRKHGSDTDPLALSYEFRPILSHAEKLNSRLRRQLSALMRYPCAGLSLTAHTLVFLNEAGVHSLGDLYLKEPKSRGATLRRDQDLMSSRLVRNLDQTVGSFRHLSKMVGRERSKAATEDVHGLALFDYSLDRMAQVSPLVLWILQKLDGRDTLNEHMEKLILEASQGEEAPEVEMVIPALQEALKHLCNRGFITVVAFPWDGISRKDYSSYSVPGR